MKVINAILGLISCGAYQSKNVKRALMPVKYSAKEAPRHDAPASSVDHSFLPPQASRGSQPDQRYS
jgi:hypothetical protein